MSDINKELTDAVSAVLRDIDETIKTLDQQTDQTAMDWLEKELVAKNIRLSRSEKKRLIQKAKKLADDKGGIDV